MLRAPHNTKVDVGTSAAASDALDIHTRAIGCVHVPSTSDITELTVYSRLALQDWGIAQDPFGNDIVIPVTPGQPIAFPDTVYAFPEIKLVATAGTAAESVPVFFKS
jgi:hypothetical protein